MLNKKGVILEIKPVPLGAWVSYNNISVGLSMQSDLQMFYITKDNKDQVLCYFWSYKPFVEAIVTALKVEYRSLHRDSVKALVKLHDELIAAHIPAFVQVLLQAQVKAGLARYAPINDGVASKIDRYFISDVLRYKPAAALFNLVVNFQTDTTKLKFDSYEDLLNQQLGNWRGLLSENGKSYRALHKTLDDWQGKAPRNILKLVEFRLEKPLQSIQARLLLALSESRVPDDVKQVFAHIVQHTSAANITALLKMPQLRQGRNRNNGEDVQTAFWNYIADSIRLEEGASYVHMKELRFLWNRALRVHQEDVRRRQARQRINDENARKSHTEWLATPTKPFPYELPVLEDGGRIRFLDTVQACHDESDLMGHCIHSYSENAVAGECFLFHVDWRGEMASAEVSPTGLIRQVKGPDNEHNGACVYASKIIGEWISQWRQKSFATKP